MALVIYNNIYSVVAQNRLATANSAISKSIERLSSGLRINHASDDASGLAISEKLRSQIRGLAKASLNAQDATSFLQTAEGGMEVISDMLQRMRELAVQAGNGTYTTNDRKELQKEVDQLKEEINRISASTEYNTKKLLTGDSAALWSTNDPSMIDAIVRGAPAEGNYKLEIEAVAGKNYVYKSDIMAYEEPEKTIDSYDYNIAIAGSGLSWVTFNNAYGEIEKEFDLTINYSTALASLQTSIATAGIYTGKLETGEDSNLAMATYNVYNGSSFPAYLLVESIKDLDLTKDTLTAANIGQYFKFYSYNIDGKRYEQTPASVSGSVIAIAGAAIDLGANAKIAKGDKLLLSKQEGYQGTPVGVTMQLSDNGARYVFTGTFAEEYAVVQMDDGGEVTVGTYMFIYSMSASNPYAQFTVTPQMVTKKLLEVEEDKTTADVNADASKIIGGLYPAGADVAVSNTGPVVEGQSIEKIYFQDYNLHATIAGDNWDNDNGSYMIEILKSGSLSSLSTDDFSIIFLDAETGLERKLTPGGAISGHFGYNSATGTLFIEGAPVIGGTAQFTITLSATANGKATAGDKLLVQSYHNPSISSTGEVRVSVDGLSLNVMPEAIGEFNIFNVELDSAGNFVKSRIMVSLHSDKSGIIRFEDPEAEVAELSTRLRDIPLFTNADGKNILDNTQELTIFGNGKTAVVYVEGSDTVEDFQNKLNAALLELGMGTGDSVVDANLVHYVTEEDATEGGNFAVAGTFILQGAIAGKNSKINIIGDQDLINALSLTCIQTGADSELDVTVRNAHNNKFIGEDTIGDGVLRGLIEGIDVKITNPKLITTYNTETGKMRFTAGDEPIKVNLHIVDNRTEVQIGANEGQTFDISIAQMDTTALEIDDAFVITMEEAQKAITKFSQALERVSSARATIGAQINRLDYTIKNLAVSRENLISAESRIRDLDVAEESAAFARNQILVNSAVAMLAQANTLPQIALQLLQ
ncbi:MAG: hypothetical protein LBP51_01450 [Deferribacteraceae bacterium]|jgi:flagellin-like hook-associated protein FlgL|nr:hypothetical protein [Deferribacteraceae bacterium]